MDSKEFLDSLVKSGELITITLNTKNSIGENDQIDATLIWNEEESIGIEIVAEFNKFLAENTNSTSSLVEKVMKQKIVIYFKSSIQNISVGWKELES